MAAIATIPTTTPAAMPALLGPPPLVDDPVVDADGSEELLAVTTTVWPGDVS